MNKGPVTITNPTSNSSGAWTYTSSNTGVATVSGNTLTLISAGGTTITGTQAPTSNKNSITVSVGFTVEAAQLAVWTTTSSSLQKARAGMSGAGVVSASVFMGSDINTYNYTDLYNGTTFSNGGNMSTNNYYNCATGSSSSCMSCGGQLTGTSHIVFNGATWSNSTAMTISSLYGGAFGTPGSAYVTGGSANSGTIVWNGSSWSAGPALATSQYYAGYCGTTLSALLAGTWSSPYSNTQQFNGSTWSSVGNLSVGREWPMCGGSDATSAFCAGGRSSGNTYSTVNEIWSGTAWATGNSLNNARYIGGSGGANNSSGIVAGGFLNGNTTRTASAEVLA